MKISERQKIINAVKKYGVGKAYSIKELYNVSSPENVRKTIQELHKSDKICKIMDGVYYTKGWDEILDIPIIPSAENIARTIANSRGQHICREKCYASNVLGFTDQIMGNNIFLTDGTSRILKTGKNTKITFKHTNKAYLFKFCSEVMQLLELANGEFDAKRASDREILKHILKGIEKKTFEADIKNSHSNQKEEIKNIYYEIHGA